MPGTHLFMGVTSKLSGLGVVGKAGLGVTLTAVGVLGAGAAGALPAPADHAVRSAIETVSPVDFDAPGDDAPSSFGQQVSADATGESDGDNGVDGPSIAATAPGAEHRDGGAAPTDPPGETGDTGLTRANQTPAAPHAPDAAAGSAPSAAGSASSAAADPRPADPPASVPSTVPARGGQAGDPEPTS